MILAGDVGGTKTVLAVFDPSGGGPGGAASCGSSASRSYRARISRRSSRSSTSSCGPREAEGLWAATFGVAGPIDNNTSKITNLPWNIDGKLLAQKLGGIRVDLMNDLQAWAMGSLVLPVEAFTVLQDGTRAAHGPIAVVAPGTGLGEAILVSDGQRYRALASEGGHADFAPTTDEEIELLRFLRARYGGHVSYERVLSGDGIGDLYDFARKQAGTPEPAWLAKDIATGDRYAVVSKAALASMAGQHQGDAVCAHALELFVAVLGAVAGNLALRVMATGGVVIGGGIPAKILPALHGDTFKARFNDKGRFTTWTRGLCVRVALEPRAALLGAAHHAATSSPLAPT